MIYWIIFISIIIFSTFFLEYFDTPRIQRIQLPANFQTVAFIFSAGCTNLAPKPYNVLIFYGNSYFIANGNFNCLDLQENIASQSAKSTFIKYNMTVLIQFVLNISAGQVGDNNYIYLLPTFGTFDLAVADIKSKFPELAPYTRYIPPFPF